GDPEHLGQLLVLIARERGQVGHVRARDHHQVAVVVGEPVEDREAVLRPAEDQVLLVVALAGEIAADAAPLRLALLDQLHPPGRPELLHHLTRLGARNMRPPSPPPAERTPSVAPWKAPWNAPRIKSRSEISCSRGGYCTFGSPVWAASAQAAATAS